MNDAIIIGAGPSGLMAGYLLNKLGLNCLILEQGKKFNERNVNNPKEVSYGFGGAGLFSDGKFSYPPSASFLWHNKNIVMLKKSYLTVRKLFNDININIADWDDNWINFTKEKQQDILVKEYEVKFLDRSSRYRILDYFYHYLNDNNCLKLNVKIINIKKMEDGYELISNTGEKFVASKLVIAIGKRSAATLLRNITEVKFKELYEMGVRLKFDQNDLVDGIKGIKPNEKEDFKYIENHDYNVCVRTFCSCWEGNVLKSLYDDSHYTYNGEHYDGGDSNIGVTVRITGNNSHFYPEMKSIYNSCSEKIISLSDYKQGKKIFGNKLDALILNIIDKIIKKDADAEIYAPEIEKYGKYPELNNNFCATSDITFIGDSTALFRGLMAAFMSGALVAFYIADDINFKKQLCKLAIKSSNTFKMKCVFTAHSKTNFYARNVICQHVLEQNCVPINPFRSFGYFLDDRVDRDIIRNANNEMISRCDELWVYGTISDGVLFEIAYAFKCGKMVRFFNVGTVIEDIKEISVDKLKFEPEVHSKKIKKQSIINYIKQEMLKQNK